MVGVDAAGQPPAVEIPVVEVVATCPERRHSPQRSGEPLELGRLVAEHGAPPPEVHPRAAGREVGHERGEDPADGLGMVIAAAQRIAGERIDASPGSHVGTLGV